jgi:hypothetical protein
MLQVKHYEWHAAGKSGRIAVKFSEHFVVKQVSGKAPPAQVLFAVLEAAPDEYLKHCNKAHRNREHAFTVEERVGMSGCIDYLLRIRRDWQMKDYPITAGIHVSMYGKLNRDVDVWQGDVVPLANAMSREQYGGYEDIILEEVPAEHYDVRQPELEIGRNDGRITFRPSDTWGRV